MSTQKDYAIKRATEGSACKRWLYAIDGKPECEAISAIQYLKANGFSTEEGWEYMRSLQPEETTIPIPTEEERYFNP